MAGPWGTPRQAVLRALAELNRNGIALVKASRLLETKPFGRPNQPDFVNAVAAIETSLPPQALLARLHAIEREAGRRRTIRWGPRTLDLDILDYRGLVSRGRNLVLPHPGIAERVFVLEPLSEIVPRWRHPILNVTAAQLMLRLQNLRNVASGKPMRKRARP
jgi:2-amino-4-hydroxy-6-hydroxymethyldihydropteridine diphosphokinase